MITHWIDDLECQAVKVNELLKKFDDCSEFVANLHRDGVALAKTEKEKRAILMALQRDQVSYQHLTQVILTGEAQTPSSAVSHRLFVSLSDDQRVIASATTERFT
jgi:hypothetical protein